MLECPNCHHVVDRDDAIEMFPNCISCGTPYKIVKSTKSTYRRIYKGRVTNITRRK